LLKDFFENSDAIFYSNDFKKPIGNIEIHFTHYPDVRVLIAPLRYSDDDDFCAVDVLDLNFTNKQFLLKNTKFIEEIEKIKNKFKCEQLNKVDFEKLKIYSTAYKADSYFKKNKEIIEKILNTEF
jgi:hypothetical protein